MFREHIVKIANLSDPVKRNAAFKKELDSRSSCRAEIVIALYRLR